MHDLILTVVGVMFLFAPLGSLYSNDKPAISTSLISSTGLFVIGGVYADLNLGFAAVVAFMTGSLWLILAIQVYKRKEENASKSI